MIVFVSVNLNATELSIEQQEGESCNGIAHAGLGGGDEQVAGFVEGVAMGLMKASQGVLCQSVTFLGFLFQEVLVIHGKETHSFFNLGNHEEETASGLVQMCRVVQHLESLYNIILQQGFLALEDGLLKLLVIILLAIFVNDFLDEEIDKLLGLETESVGEEFNILSFILINLSVSHHGEHQILDKGGFIVVRLRHLDHGCAFFDAFIAHAGALVELFLVEAVSLSDVVDDL